MTDTYGSRSVRLTVYPEKAGGFDAGLTYAFMAVLSILIAKSYFIVMDNVFSFGGKGMPLCPMKAVTGIPCLTCGATRCASALAGFDFLLAIHMNPLVFGLFLFVIAWGVWSLLARFIPSLRVVIVIPRPLWVAMVALLVALAGFNWAYLIIDGR